MKNAIESEADRVLTNLTINPVEIIMIIDYFSINTVAPIRCTLVSVNPLLNFSV